MYMPSVVDKPNKTSKWDSFPFVYEGEKTNYNIEKVTLHNMACDY